MSRAVIAWHGAQYPAPRLMEYIRDDKTNLSILVINSLLEKCCVYGKAPLDDRGGNPPWK